MIRKLLGAAAIAASLAAAPAASAYDAVELRFSRSGSDAQSVALTAVDPATGDAIPGVAATLSSASHPFKTSGTAVTTSVVCPDVNGNTSPTIELTFSVTGLPSSFTISSLALDIHALNAGGAYQSPTDGKDRQWNITATSGSTTFGPLADIDIAAGVGTTDAVHQTWTLPAAKALAASSPLSITVAATKGTSNSGCFIGFSSLTLASDGATVTPTDPVTPPVDPTPADGNTFAAGIYLIKWKNNTQSYMTERSAYTMGIDSYAVTNACFWEFIPTGKTDCYYIRSVASGRYIQSCNLNPSSASKISTVAEPVEYYIGTGAATSGDNRGCYWMSSTDCANYSDESAGPRALNKDGASTDIITWTAGVGNVGSYWTILPAEESYEARPFSPSASLDHPGAIYGIANAAGQLWTAAGTWAANIPSATTQSWYFVGTNNAEGYMIASYATRQPLNGGVRYSVATDADGRAVFTSKTDGTTLTLGSASAFAITPRRTPYALRTQIYSMPCGTLGQQWITGVDFGSGASTPLSYPATTAAGRPAATRPSSWYTMYTVSRATVTAGTTVDLDVTLNAATTATLTAYADWDRDGLFETAIPVSLNATSGSAGIAIPADAREGSSRLRLRLTSNGLTGADDETAGQVLDLIVNVTTNTPEATLTVKSSDTSRGTATASNGHAIAHAIGTAAFISWMEGRNVVSTEADYAPSLTRPMTLVAHFTPNLNDAFGGIDTAGVDIDTATEITVEGHTIVAPGARAIAVFTPTGALAARASAERLNASALAPGIYIVKAITATGIASAKIIL